MVIKLAGKTELDRERLLKKIQKVAGFGNVYHLRSSM